jgi:hypothetical protein
VPIWKIEAEQIAEKHILHLFQAGVHEGQYLDYKRADILKKGNTKELLKDICAMANKGGGDHPHRYKREEWPASDAD